MLGRRTQGRRLRLVRREVNEVARVVDLELELFHSGIGSRRQQEAKRKDAAIKLDRRVDGLREAQRTAVLPDVGEVVVGLERMNVALGERSERIARNLPVLLRQAIGRK